MNINMGVIVGAKEATIGKVLVDENSKVVIDQELLTYESKKGSYTLKSPMNGIISKVLFSDGDIIKKDDLLFVIDEEKDVVIEKSKNVNTIQMTAIVGAKEATVGCINVTCGQQIKKDDELFQFETKKGNRAFKASIEGQITKIYISEGQRIEKDFNLFDIKEVSSKIEEPSNDKIVDIKNITTDLLIIGAGPGGYVAAIYAAKNGKKVTLLEKEYLGGTCLNVGCIPTKALVKSSEVCHSANTSEKFGIKIDKSAIKVDMNEVINHKNDVVERLVGGIEGLLVSNNITLIRGMGKFISKSEVEVIEKDSKTMIKATDIIIATGSKISSIPIPGLNLPFVLNSTSALSLKQLPKSIAIVGGGVIGMEFAFLYHNLGVEVTVIEYMDRLLTMIDKDMSDYIKSIAINKGIKVYNDSKVLELSCDVHNKAIVTFEHKDNKKHLVSDKVLMAIGRQPNLEGLNLEAARIEMDTKRRGIKVDSSMRTNQNNIYAVGDVTNIIQLAHVASHQGLVAVDNILGKNKKMDYSAVPNVIFTSPEIASVGTNEDTCKKENIEYKVSTFYYTGNGKAITMEETDGYVKIIENTKTLQIIGASIIGADASNLISTLALAIQNKLTSEQIRETIFPHPTTSEVLHEAAMGLGIGTLHQ